MSSIAPVTDADVTRALTNPQTPVERGIKQLVQGVTPRGLQALNSLDSGGLAKMARDLMRGAADDGRDMAAALLAIAASRRAATTGGAA